MYWYIRIIIFSISFRLSRSFKSVMEMIKVYKRKLVFNFLLAYSGVMYKTEQLHKSLFLLIRIKNQRYWKEYIIKFYLCLSKFYNYKSPWYNFDWSNTCFASCEKCSNIIKIAKRYEHWADWEMPPGNTYKRIRYTRSVSNSI